VVIHVFSEERYKKVAMLECLIVLMLEWLARSKNSSNQTIKNTQTIKQSDNQAIKNSDF
jgi:hypothetical protein